MGVCSLWRHVTQGKLMGLGKRLAAAEYGENGQPKFIDLSRDKEKLDKLSDEWRKRKGKELKQLERAQEKKKEDRVEKGEKRKSNEKHSKELQSFIDKHETEDKNKNKKNKTMREWCEQTGWSEEQMEEYWAYYWTEVQKEELARKYSEELWK
ncbi:hypothetical protein RFI_33592, partial [Reticulomyxa filosa]